MPLTQYDNLIVFYTHLKGDKSPLDLVEGPRVLYTSQKMNMALMIKNLETNLGANIILPFDDFNYLVPKQ